MDKWFKVEIGSHVEHPYRGLILVTAETISEVECFDPIKQQEVTYHKSRLIFQKKAPPDTWIDDSKPRPEEVDFYRLSD